MADNSTQIDELRLDITVEDKTSGESSDKKVRALATAISRLNSIVNKFDSAKMSNVFANMAKGIEPFVSKIKGVEKALNSLDNIAKKGGFKEISQATKNISIGKERVEPQSIAESSLPKPSNAPAQELETAKNNADSLSSSIVNISNQTELLKAKLQMVNSELQNSGLTEKKIISLKQQQLNIEQQLGRAQGKRVKMPMGQIVKQFGRVAMYRAIRTVLKEIAQAFTESIAGIASFNNEFRDSMGGIQSSLAKIKTSIGVAFYQVLILIEPIISQLANGIANLANSISKVTANMRGVANYTKINTDYMEKYKSAIQGTLLAFDTFTTLNSSQSIDYSQMFEEADDALDTEKFSQTETTILEIFNLIKNIIEIVKTIMPIISPIISAILKLVNSLLPAINKLIKQISPTLKPIISMVVDSIKFITDLIVALINLITGDLTGAVENLGSAFGSVGNLFGKVFEKSVNFAIDSVNLILKPIDWIAGLFGAKPNTVQIPNVKFFANGGLIDGAGTMYAIAGEAGAEVVAKGPAGTGVLNVEQFSDAMVSALVRYGAARDNGGNGVIEIDGNRLGTYIAGNKGFRNEANRRNANLNWK